MTVAVVCLDGLDWRLAGDVDLFRDVPVAGQRLLNDLDGDKPRFTPRVWTSVMAGVDQDVVTGWRDGLSWRQAMNAKAMTFFWDRFPDTRVHDLAVHRGGLTRSDVFPDDFAGAAGDMAALKRTAKRRRSFLNDELARDPQAVVAWFGFPDRAGHFCGRHGQDLRPSYTWVRDDFLPGVDWPDDVVILSDHGFGIPERIDWNESWAGRKAHTEHGVLATSPSLADLRTYDRLSTFIPNWQDDIAAALRTQRLADLGYVGQDGSG